MIDTVFLEFQKMGADEAKIGFPKKRSRGDDGRLYFARDEVGSINRWDLKSVKTGPWQGFSRGYLSDIVLNVTMLYTCYNN